MSVRSVLCLAVPILGSCLLQSVGSELFASCDDAGGCAGYERLSLLQREAAWSREVQRKSARPGSRRQQELKEEEARSSPISKHSGEPEDHTAFDSYDKFMNSTSLVQSSPGFSVFESKCEGFVPQDGMTDFCNCQAETPVIHEKPEHAPDYINWAMWRPSPVETVLHAVHQHHGADHILQSAQKVMPSPGYNPSLIRLPRDIAASLHPEAHFLTVVRHSNSLCGEETYAFERNYVPDEASIVVMDKDFQELILATLPVVLQDWRLMTLHGKILATGNALTDGPEEARWRWNVFEVKLTVGAMHHNCPKDVRVEMQRFVAHGMSDRMTSGEDQSRFLGKNLGLFSDQNDDLQVVYMLTNPVDVRHWTKHRPQHTQIESTDLRNNGNPIYLEELDAYLAVGHQYFHTDVVGIKRLYVHRLVIFDAKPPYKWIRASQPFCIPTISSTRELEPHARKEWCEGRQFIMSWIRDGSDVVFSYGISDCESATAVLPMDFIVNYTSTNLSWNLPKDLSAPTQQGAWDFFLKVPPTGS